MRKTKWFSALAMAAVMLPAATSCNDKNDEPVVNPSEWALPSTDFGNTLEEVTASETARGFQVTKLDSIHLRVTKNIKNAQVSYTYSFDPDTKIYRYAEGSYAGSDELSALTQRLATDGYAAESEQNGVKVYNKSNDFAHVALEEDSSKFYMLPGASNDAFSWGPPQRPQRQGAGRNARALPGPLCSRGAGEAHGALQRQHPRPGELED